MILHIFLCALALCIVFSNTKSFSSFVFIILAFLTPVALSAPWEVSSMLSISMFCVAIGGLLYNIFFHKNITRIRQAYFLKPLRLGTRSLVRFDLAVDCLFWISAIFSIYYFSKVGIALFSDEVGLERLLVRHAVPGSYLFQRLFRLVLPILCLILYLQSSVYGAKYRLKFLLVLLIASAFLIFTGLRGNLVTFIFTPFVICNGLLSDSASMAKSAIALLLAVFSGLYITMLMYGQSDIGYVFQLIIERLTILASDGLTYVYYDKVPREGFLFGQSWVNDFLSLFSKLGIGSFDVMNYSAQVASDLLGERYNGEQAAVYLFGELYANFGYVGVLLGSLLLGAGLQSVYCFVLSLDRSILIISILSYTQASILLVIGGPSFSMLIDYVISIFLFYAAFIISYSFLNPNLSRNPGLPPR